jgi:ATP-dependent DNA ligase
MDLPVNPPVAPMLAKPVDAIPSGDYVFEPKWDGFRSIIFRDRDEVEIGSRNERPMTRYFRAGRRDRRSAAGTLRDRRGDRGP